MRLTRNGRALVALLAILPLGLAGCREEAPADGAVLVDAEEAAAKSRERVQTYLDALTAKDVAAGRSQFCVPLQAAFDAAATGRNGDFADHFTVSAASVTEVSAGPQGHEVSTAITVDVSGKTVNKALLFTVASDREQWCIADEQPAGSVLAGSASGSASPKSGRNGAVPATGSAEDPSAVPSPAGSPPTR